MECCPPFIILPVHIHPILKQQVDNLQVSGNSHYMQTRLASVHALVHIRPPLKEKLCELCVRAEHSEMEEGLAFYALLVDQVRDSRCTIFVLDEFEELLDELKDQLFESAIKC